MIKELPYKTLFKCVACGYDSLKRVLDLNDQPLANSYLKSENQVEYRYPLKLNYCRACTHLQLDVAVDPDLLFKNYLYVSGTTNTLQGYFKEFVDIVKQYTGGKKVLDIACNDGTQLDFFKQAGYETYGIDPAQNLFELSSKKHKVICNYFNDVALDNLDKDFDIIVAQNVFAHVSDPLSFLTNCKKVLRSNGHIFIQTSQADMVKNNEFDTIYHEHISFFNMRSFCMLANRANLNVIDVIKTPVHGTSYVFILSNGGLDKSIELLRKEKVLDLETLFKYSSNVSILAKKARSKASSLRSLGYTIIGYGAAAKGNTFLNFSDMPLDYIVDDNPLKQGLFTPGKKIPIRPPHAIGLELGKVLIIPLAWNFFDEIKTKVREIKKDNTKFMRYFPEVEIIDA